MIELKNITFSAEGASRKDIVDDVSLIIPSDSVFVLTGPNGGGKSTLAKIIMGIVSPTSGRILFNGVDITNMNITERAKCGIGYAFQTPPRFKGLTVHKLLNIACGKNLSVEECCKILKLVGICSKEFVNRPLDASLSGGELKRIEVASLLARDLKLAMYDEPEAGIDIWSFDILINAFKSVGKKGNIIIISHQERIFELADHIAVIADGKIADYGSRDKIITGIHRFFDVKPCSQC